MDAAGAISHVEAEIIDLPVADARLGLSPRQDGESVEHIRTLAERADDWHPILVHRPTGLVIDGAHRLLAARLRGEKTIRARLFDGDDADAFVLAVQANAAHGLPLTRRDRTTAASRILASHPHWSDRRIASVSGVAARTVAELRCSIGNERQLNTRRGRDGKSRPVDSTAGRLRAKELLEAHPDASLRLIAREAGLSPATVADVRRRLGNGEDVMPRRAGSSRNCRSNRRELVDYGRVVSLLQRDPVLRASKLGRSLLPILNLDPTDSRIRKDLLEPLPCHTVMLIAKAADGWAKAWETLANELAAAANTTGSDETAAAPQ